MNTTLSSQSLETVQSYLDTLSGDSEALLSGVGAPQATSLDELYAPLRSLPHGAYIAIWTLGMLAKNGTPWAIAQENLMLFYKNIQQLPDSLRHLSNLRTILISFNPLSDLSLLATLPKLQEVILSESQKELLPDDVSFSVGYTYVMNLSLDQGSPSVNMDLTIVPADLKEAKRQYLSGTPEGKSAALALVKPFIDIFYISDNVDAVCEEEIEDPMRLLAEEDVILTHLVIHFDEESIIPSIGAAGETVFFFREPQSSDELEHVQWGVSVEFIPPHKENDFIGVFDGWHRADILHEEYLEHHKCLPRLEKAFFSALHHRWI